MKKTPIDGEIVQSVLKQLNIEDVGKTSIRK